MSKLISELDPSMQKKARAAWETMQNDVRLKSYGVETVAISETKRDLAVQMAYYSRGRMEAKDVRMMYAVAGLYDPSDVECRTINTNTLRSKHIQGLAIDLVPVKNNKYWWDAPKEVWERMGEIGEQYGLKWGGRWKDFQDCPHFEI
ncbi:MAG: M15 family metallopeptidase [Treponema sp.]|nr:M15 family metallopeptidase [Treponema sp.]